MTSLWALVRALVSPLRSRKVRVALATGLAAWAADRGLDVDPVLVVGILGLGTATILGIAHEDHGAKSNSSQPSSSFLGGNHKS